MPAAELISFMTATKWIKSLASQYTKIRDERGDEITALANEFGNPADLTRFYVHPNCLSENPADSDEDNSMRQPMEPLFDILEDFFARDIRARDGRRHLFLMADAGMGKTSALVMLRLAYICSFWPRNYECQLFKLGPDTLERIAAVPSQSNTILLLDALDEDSQTTGASIENRLHELIIHTRNFHRVVITCRTQFFPGTVERLGKIRIGNAYVCQSLYLAPFSDQQVEDYLKKSFPRTWRDWLRLRENPELAPARQMAATFRSLRFRPMLLAHIEDLVHGEFEPGDEFAVYQHLLNKWLEREEDKSIERRVKGESWPHLKVQELGHACARVAIWLQNQRQRLIHPEDLAALIAEDPLVKHLQFVEVGGRSLLNRTSEGEYRFSHYSVQEFLVALAAVKDQLPGDVQPFGTAQILRFIQCWMHGRDPLPYYPLARLRWSHLPWAELLPSLSSRDLRGIDLRGANLAGANLANANLEGANLTNLSLGITHIALSDQAPMGFVNLTVGAFTMGSPASEAHRDDDEVLHTVRLSPFELAEAPVTRAQWHAVMGNDPSHDFEGPRPDNQPVQNVSWFDAIAFCNALSAREGKTPYYTVDGEDVSERPDSDGYRLPTEAEWEYACRASSAAAYCFGDDPGQLKDYARYREDGRKSGPLPVKSLRPNAWGFHDMHGNVWEWVRDWYGPYPLDQPHNPRGAPSNTRVLRGGGFVSGAGNLRSADRDGIRPSDRFVNYGFRCARDVPPASNH